jgi:thymidylate kinase/transcription elongation GreA/GreB family factor
MASPAASTKGAFVVLEGLTGVGKSTLVQNLAEELDLDWASVQATEYQAAVKLLEDDTLALEARHLLFFSAITLAARQINDLLDEGKMVIVDSWVYRTQATHLALGSSLTLKIPTWFPQPDVKILLTCEESARQKRIQERGTSAGYWKRQCEEHSEEILAWYRKNIKGLVEVDTNRDISLVMGELVSRVRPTVRKRRDLLKSKDTEENLKRRFLQPDLDALDEDIVHCRALIKEAKDMGQEATEQSSESWHDNYNFEESQRQLKMHMNNLGRLSNAREKAEIVTPSEVFETVDVGAHVEFKIHNTEKTGDAHVGSYLVGEQNRIKGFMSYDAPRVAGLMGSKVGETRRIQLDGGMTDVVITAITRSPLL